MAITVTNSRNATIQDRNLASAGVGFIQRNDAAGLAAAATAAGLTSVGGNQYQGRDGSWVMMDGNGMIQRGQHNTQFVGMPQNAGQAARTVGRPAARAQPQQQLTVQHMRTTALARLPVERSVTQNYLAALRQQGFVASGNSYVHSDGSRVDVGSGRPVVSYNGIPLQNLPTWWR